MALVGVGTFNVAYERVVHPKITLGVNVRLTHYVINTSSIVDDVDVKDARLSLSGPGIAPEIRFYPGKRGGPRGFFIGAYMPITFLTIKQTGIFTIDIDDNNARNGVAKLKVDGEIKNSLNGFGLGLVLGGQALINDKFAIDLAFGIAYHNFNLGDFFDAKAKILESSEPQNNDYRIGRVYTDTVRLEEVVDDEDATSRFKNMGILLPRLNFSIGFAF